MPKTALVFLLLLLAGCTSRQVDPFYLGGIMINEPDHERWAKSLVEADMNTVSATVYARQGIWNSDNIWWNEEEEAVVSEIKVAKENGLQVVLILRVLLDHYFDENKFLWHGMVLPKNDSTMTQWFTNYGMFVQKWSAIAEELQIDVLCVGSELRALSSTLPVDTVPELLNYYLDSAKQQDFIALHEKYEERLRANDLWVRGYGNYLELPVYLADKQAKMATWAEETGRACEKGDWSGLNETKALQDSLWRVLIRNARTEYSGKIGYAANFDNYQNVGFWSELDIMGINAYFKMRSLSQELTLPVLKANWQSHLAEISEFQLEEGVQNMPVVFTELGYVSREGCTLAPWQGFGYSLLEEHEDDSLVVWSRQPTNFDERALAVEGLADALSADTLVNFDGLLYWKLTSDTSLLKHEPFGLSISPDSLDPLLPALQRLNEL